MEKWAAVAERGPSIDLGPVWPGLEKSDGQPTAANLIARLSTF